MSGFYMDQTLWDSQSQPQYQHHSLPYHFRPEAVDALPHNFASCQVPLQICLRLPVSELFIHHPQSSDPSSLPPFIPPDSLFPKPSDFSRLIGHDLFIHDTQSLSIKYRTRNKLTQHCRIPLQIFKHIHKQKLFLKSFVLAHLESTMITPPLNTCNILHPSCLQSFVTTLAYFQSVSSPLVFKPAPPAVSGYKALLPQHIPTPTSPFDIVPNWKAFWSL
ncbi:hypothetical protein CU098_010034 [Rhizopus stolonifer]|uniref:Uncharacterized protein n=1 Tax=Rhizopus stolonifer TaxID=4846 RepID=A0A367JP21_RHIST|nr:hypothetical protein CU098_010034 [Rhizopus stolonifer]